jgi:hypothetical protein
VRAVSTERGQEKLFVGADEVLVRAGPPDRFFRPGAAGGRVPRVPDDGSEGRHYPVLAAEHRVEQVFRRDRTGVGENAGALRKSECRA